MKSSSKTNVFLLVFLAFAGVAAVLWALAHYAETPLSAHVLTGSRWVALLAFCAYAWTRRSLTTWIVAGIFFGAEFGHDWPAPEAGRPVRSGIFLRVIKKNNSPPLFSTLVGGLCRRS